MGFQQSEGRANMKEDIQGIVESSVQSSLAKFGQDKQSVTHPLSELADSSSSISRLSFHDEDLSSLLKHGVHAVTPTELVLAPVDLHRRVIKHRLADEGQPRDSMHLCKPVDVVAELLEAKTGDKPGTVDRIDRLSLLEDLLERHSEVADRFQVIFGSSPADSVKLVEQARTEIESITGYHPERIEQFREFCQQQGDPVGADGLDILEGTVEIERHLRQQTDCVTSKEALVRWACREMRKSDGVLWKEQFAHIDRVWLCGVSTISASLGDWLTCLLSKTDVDVHIYVRDASETVIRERLPQLLGIEEPGEEVFDVHDR